MRARATGATGDAGRRATEGAVTDAERTEENDAG
jgi:hypothetical protein